MAKHKLGKKAQADKTIHLDEIYRLKGDPKLTRFRLVTEGSGFTRTTRLFLGDGSEITGLLEFSVRSGGHGEAGLVTLTFARDQFTSELAP